MIVILALLVAVLLLLLRRVRLRRFRQTDSKITGFRRPRRCVRDWPDNCARSYFGPLDTGYALADAHAILVAVPVLRCAFFWLVENIRPIIGCLFGAV